MKRTEIMSTEQNLYLHYGSYKDNKIARLLSEKLAMIILENGPNISISIKAFKHVMRPEDKLLTVVNGLVHCRIGDESVLLTPEEAGDILWRDWYDYEITYETGENKK